MAFGLSAGTAFIDVRPDMTKFGATLGTQSKGIFGKIGSNLGGIFAGAFAAKAIIDFGGEAIDAAEEAAAQQRKTMLAIQGDLDGANIKFEELTGWAENFGNSIGMDDEEILKMTGQITQAVDATKLFGEEGAQQGIQDMTQTILDMSTAVDKSPRMIQRMFNTIANDPGTALTQLQKYGAITEEQVLTFEKMIERGEGAKVTQELLGITHEKYAGQAEAGATASDKLGAVWDNLKEKLGEFLLPLFEKFVGWLVKFIDTVQTWFRRNQDTIKQWFSAISTAIGGAIRIIKGIIEFLVGVFTGDWQKVWRGIKNIFAGVWQGILNIVKNIGPVLLNIIWKLLKAVVGFFASLPGRVVGVLAKLPRMLWDLAWKAVTFLLRGAKNAIGAVWEWFKSLPGKILSFFADVGSWLWEAGKDLAAGFGRGVQDGMQDVADWLLGPFINIGEVSNPGELGAALSEAIQNSTGAFAGAGAGTGTGLGGGANRATGGGGASNKTVNVNVDGGNPAEVRRAVRDALNDDDRRSGDFRRFRAKAEVD